MTCRGVSDDLCVKLRRTNKSFPFNHTLNMMLHHQNHCRPFLSSDGVGFGDHHGPTAGGVINSFITANNIYNFATPDGGAAPAATGGWLRTMQQPFDLSPTEATISAFNFKSPGGIMAASVGFPFTNAQWRELERQAMIFKYMTASIPIPPHLLMSTSRNLHSGSDPLAAACHSSLGSCLNLRLAKGADLEPGRCRRTDGKKWRCSRDVAPDQKYCERHMHRGRPRSRKPVELHVRINKSNDENNNNNSNKKIRYNPSTSMDLPVTMAVSNPNSVVASQFFGNSDTSQPYIRTPVFLDKSSSKVSTFDATLASLSTYNQPRSLDWMMRGENIPVATTDQQWHSLVQTEIGLATDRSFNNSVLNQQYQEGSLNLNSFGVFDEAKDRQSDQCSLFLNDTPRSFIDAWSNVASEDNNPNTRNTISIHSRGNISHSSLTLSMGGTDSMDDEMGQIQMGLRLISKQNQDCSTCAPTSWTANTPGGPLAEVLQLSSAVNSTEELSPVAENGDCSSPPPTMVSSPSGVLQKTLASFSDSSANSSPKLRLLCCG